MLGQRRSSLLVQCRQIVYDAGPTLLQHRVCCIPNDSTSPANTCHSPNTVSMLTQRLRRWPDIETSLGDYPVFAAVLPHCQGGGPRVVVTTAALNAKVWGLFPGLGSLEETKMFLPHPLIKFSIVGSLHDHDVACSASDLQGLYFESCVWMAVSSHSSHNPQEVLLGQFSLHVHKSGLKPDSFHFFRRIVMRVMLSSSLHQNSY